MNNLKGIRAVIFDLDGTLYQDHHIHLKYMELLVAGTPWQSYMHIISEEMDEILQGNRPFKLGHAYRHTERDAPIESIEQLLEFDGIRNGSSGSFPSEWLSDPNIIYAGDPWSLCTIIAKRIGISREQGNQAFAKVREGMHVAGTTVEHHDGLSSALQKLKQKLVRSMIVSNTPESMASDLAVYLNVHEQAHDYYYGAGKPHGLMKMLPDWLRKHGLEAHEVLAVGDNGLNDLYPIRQLGGKAALISPYEVDDRINWDFRLRELDELVDLIDRIADA